MLPIRSGLAVAVLTAAAMTAAHAPVGATTAAPTSVAATTVASNTAPRVQLIPVASVNEPVGLAARSGDATLFVLEKAGRVRLLRDGVVDPVAALDITASTSTQNERGLLGLAFSPLDQRLAYLTHTDKSGAVVVFEMPVDATGRFDTSARRELLRVPKQWNDHNGGSLAFDRNGLLYIGLGDGGGVGDGPKKFGDPLDNAQRLDRLLGKVLRIDPRPGADGKPYRIPPDNPFAPGSPRLREISQRFGTRPRPEIWVFGVRNPWRIAIDHDTSTLWIADVGQAQWEEVNRLPLERGGYNLGWKRLEGSHPYRGAARPADATDPVYEYTHGVGRCAVIGGAVYRGTAIPELVGRYVLGDLCGGSMTALRVVDDRRIDAVELGVGTAPLSGWGTGSDGELYALNPKGTVLRLGPAPRTAATAPVASTVP